MTVESATDAEVICIWFEGKRRNRKPFPAATLRARGRVSKRPPNIVVEFVAPDGHITGTKKFGPGSN